MTPHEFRDRTNRFALAVVALVRTLPRGTAQVVPGNRLLRSATSVAANYRAACRSRSRREFVAKLGVVEEEADESLFWLEILGQSGLAKPEAVVPLQMEAHELVSLTVASIRTARHRAQAGTPNPQSAIRNPQ